MNTPALTRAGLGFIAAVASVLVFHQGMWIILWLVGLMPRAPFPTNAVPPLGIPQIVNLCFWGGLYGAAFGLLLPRLPPTAARWLLGLCLGLVAVLVGWFVVAPIKGLPVAAGWVPMRMLISVLINGVWGIGTALILQLLLSRRAAAAE